MAAGRTGAFFQGLLVLIALALTGLGVTLKVAPERLARRVEDYADAIGTLWLPLLAMGVTLLLLVLWLRRRDLLVRLAATSLTIWVFVSLLVWPRVDPHRTPQALMAQVEQMLTPTSELGLLYFKEQFLLFSQRPLTHFSYLAPLDEQERNAWVWMKERPERFLLPPTDAVLACFDVAKARSLGEAHRREWVVYGADAMQAACDPPQEAVRFVYRPDPKGVLE